MNTMQKQILKIEPVRKSVVVRSTAQRAFEVFTGGIDRWWPKAHTIGTTPLLESFIEPFVGGRWYGRHADGAEVAIGHVLVWEPGARFVCTWEISADWKPDARDAYTSEIDVRFADQADGTTRIELEHRNFERMGAAAGEKMRGEVERGWPAIIELLVNEIRKEQSA